MQNHPKPDLKLILRPNEDFRDIFQPGWPGPYFGRRNIRVDRRSDTALFTTVLKQLLTFLLDRFRV